jgi:hypothetical protein
MMGTDTVVTLNSSGATMADLAAFLTNLTDREVIDAGRRQAINFHSGR